MEKQNTVEKIFVKGFCERGLLHGGSGDGNVREVDAVGLIELLEAIDERAALNSDAIVVLNNTGVRSEKLRSYVEFDVDGVTLLPALMETDVPAIADQLDIQIWRDGPAGAAPIGIPHVDGEFRGRRGIDLDIDSSLPRVVCPLRELNGRAVLQVPIEGGVVEEVDVEAIGGGGVEVTGE